MSKKILVIFAAVAVLMVSLSCKKDEGTGPNGNNHTDLGIGIYVNKSVYDAKGIATLYVNKGDTVQLTVSSILPNEPQYTWQSLNEDVIKIIPDATVDSVAYAVALGDSGLTAKIKITDSANKAEKTITANVTHMWADPNRFTLLGKFGGHTYYISKEVRGWVQAKALCEEAGGHLVSITTAEENNFLNLKRGRIENVWIGARIEHDPPSNPKWSTNKWVTGEPIGYNGFADSTTDPGIFMEIYWYMNINGKWVSWHEISYNYFLEMEP
jgi:hypothetical protein